MEGRGRAEPGSAGGGLERPTGRCLTSQLHDASFIKTLLARKSLNSQESPEPEVEEIQEPDTRWAIRPFAASSFNHFLLHRKVGKVAPSVQSSIDRKAFQVITWNYLGNLVNW